MNKRVTVHEAEENFMSLLDQARAGETVDIFQDGKPVAQLHAVESCVSRHDPAAREEARKRLLEKMRKGFHLGGEKFDRESVYDRFDR